MKKLQLPIFFILLLTICLAGEAIGAVVTTRVTGAANWSTASTWIQNRTGTITASNVSTTVTGVGTAFDTELSPGDILVLQGAPGTVIGTIASITNASQLTLTANAGANAAAQSYGREAVPSSSDDLFIGNSALAGAAVTVTLDVASATVNSLTFTTMALANTLTHTGVNNLTVTNGVTINQPTGAVTVSWNINAGTATVNGAMTIGGANTTASRVAQTAVTTGALTVAGSLTFVSNTNAADELVSVTTGTISLNSALALSSGTLSVTGAGTINFNAGMTFGGANTPVFSTVAASNLNIGGNLSAITTALTFNGTSNVTFANTSTVTPTAAITFGNVQLNPGVIVSLGGSVTVAGNWTDNGGTFLGGANTVTFSGAAKTIGGTAGNTTFPGVVIASGATYTTNINTTCSGLILAASSIASSLTQTAGITVNGTVTINQPTAGATTSWNVNAGTATVNGDVLLGGGDLTPSRIAQIAVTTGSLTVTGALTYASNSSAATEVVSVTTGAITLNNALTMSFGTLSMTGAGTINFNGGLTFGGVNNPVLATIAASNLNFGGNLTALTTPLTLNGTSNTVFTNTSTITPSAAITFGNIQLNSGVSVTLAGNITVAGNWTDNGGTFTGGANTVTFSGAAKTIGGTTGATVLPAITIASGASYTENINMSCNSLSFAASSAASSLTQGAVILTVNGNVTINQPTAGFTTSWNINTGTGTVNGNISIGGINTTSSRVAQLAVTTGSLTVTGSLTYISNTSPATEVVSVTTGTITLNNALTLTSGTLSMTGAGTINFNGGLTFGGANSPVLATIAGSNLNIGGNFSSTTTPLTLNGTSNTTFTNTSTITPTSTMTFGNVQINSGIAVTLGGNVTVAGNWTDNAGSFVGGANTITLSGLAKTIGGTAGSTSLPTLVIASGASYTENINMSCSSLTFAASSAASSLTQGAVTLTVNGNVIINQPTAGFITSWNINTGTATVNGDVLIGGANTTPSRVAQLAVTTGSLTVTGFLTYTSISSPATEVVSVTTGTITLNNALTLNSGTLSMTGAGTINFNGGLAFGGANAPVFFTAAGSNLNIGGNFSATTTPLTLNGTSNTTFTTTSTITPTAVMSFGNILINPGVVITTVGNVTVAGNWTNNGGTFAGGANTVIFTGLAKTIGGTAGTDFPAIVIATGATYTLNSNTTSTTLTFNPSSTASSLTLGAVTFTVNGNVIINQPTAGFTTSWNINAGTATVNGDVLIGGANTTSSRVAQLAVTTGSLTVTGFLTYTSNSSPATEVVSVTTGTITLNNALTLTSGTLSMTGAGTINFNGGVAFGGANNPVLATIAGSNLNIGGNFSATTTPLTLNGTSNATFTNTSTITPTSAMTFGNVQINSGVIVTLGGNVTVAGNWTDNAGSFVGGANTMTFSGLAKTIGGTASSTILPALVIASGASYTENINMSCNSLTFSPSAAASSLTQGAVTLTVNGNVVINQPTAGFITSWNINTGTATVNGDVLIGGANTTSSRVAQLAVTTGALTVTGFLTYTSNSNPATELVGVTTGTITLNNTLTLASGTLSMTGAGTINFNGGLAFGGANAPVFFTAAGSNLNMGGDFVATTTPLILNGTSNTIFTSTSTITPTSAMTFGNLLVNARVNLMLAGSITVNGNLALQLKSTLDPGSFGLTLRGNLVTDGILFPSTSTVILSGNSAQSISGLMPTLFNNLTINNISPAGVTLAEDVDINGTLTLTGGSFSLGANTLTLNGSVSRTGGSLIGGISSNIVVGEPGSATTLPPVTVNNLTLDRAAGINLGGNIGVNGTLTLTNGTLSLGANTLTLNGVISQSGGSLSGGGSSNITIGNSGSGTALPAVTLNNLTMNRGAGITLIGDISINGLLTFTSGNITTGANMVTVGPGGNVVRTSGHVVGTLRKNVAVGSNVLRLFEVGDASNYTPASVFFGNVSSPGNITSSTTAGDHPNIASSGIIPAKSVNRYWTLSNDSVAFNTYNARFNFVPADIDAGANTSNFIVQKFDSSAWISPTIGTRTSTNIQATGMTSFSDFAVGEIASYTIAASAGAGGTISPSGVISVLHGSTHKFNLLPNVGYHVSDLSVDGVHEDSTTSYTFTNITTSHTIAVLFAIDVHTITATASAHGTIAPSGAVGVNYGANQHFTITPDVGYHLDSLMVDGVKVDSTSGYTFSNVTADHSISALFAINQFAISAAAGPNGSISPSGLITANYGTTQIFTLTPATGYHVDSLIVDGVKIDSTTSYTFTNVQANHTINVKFAINAFTITATAGTHGNITPSGSIGVSYGGTRAFTFTPATGYHTDSVFVDGVYVADSTISYTFTNITANHTISVKFFINSYTITASAGVGGTISPTGGVQVTYGADTTFQISPNAGYFITDVFVDTVSTGKRTSYIFSSVAANHTIQALFHPDTAPTASSLFTPVNGDTIQLTTLQPSVSFTWYKSTDVDIEDTVKYSIHVRGPGLDTTAAGLTDTSVVLNIMSRLQTSSVYTWTVNATDGFYVVASPDTFTFNTSSTITGVHDGPKGLPKEYALRQNYPNPFNPEATVLYQLPEESKVSLRIYNLLGQTVEVLKDGIEQAGYKSVVWNANAFPSGVYFYRLEATSMSHADRVFTQMKKMVLVK